MVQAKVTKAFKGVDDGQCIPRDVELGEIISGDLARVAIQEGWAERLETGEPDRIKTGSQGQDPNPDEEAAAKARAEEEAAAKAKAEEEAKAEKEAEAKSAEEAAGNAKNQQANSKNSNK